MNRTLEQLNLLDDFLFGSVMSYPEIGEAFCRKILKILLEVDVEKIHVVPQKVYYGADTNLHGTRLDVYIEESGEAGASYDVEDVYVEETGETGAVYDIEPDKNSSDTQKRALPRRVRFYHSKIDERSLRSGEDYSSLKRVIILLIMPYDPFGKDRVLYTVRRHCEEEPDMKYDDGSVTYFFYTKGKKGEISEAARKLLRYMEESGIQNADDECLRELHQMVETVRHDKEVSLRYMKSIEREKMIREEGVTLERLDLIRNMRETMKAEQIAQATKLDQGYVEEIFELLDKYSEKSDDELVEKLLTGKFSGGEDEQAAQ